MPSAFTEWATEMFTTKVQSNWIFKILVTLRLHWAFNSGTGGLK
jgi:hypothetical protein